MIGEPVTEFGGDYIVFDLFMYHITPTLDYKYLGLKSVRSGWARFSYEYEIFVASRALLQLSFYEQIIK